MVKWGLKKYGLQKGRLRYCNLQLPWLAMGYQFKQTSLPSFSPFLCVATRWIYLQQFDKTILQHLTLITWVPTCEQQTNLFKQTMPMALENLAIAQHCNNLKYVFIWRYGYHPKMHQYEPRDYNKLFEQYWRSYGENGFEN